MKKYPFLFSIVSLFCIIVASEARQQSSKQDIVRIMTCNVRREGSEVEGKNIWKNRKARFCDLINSAGADIIGFQEPIKSQIGDIASTLPSFTWFGEARGRFAQKLWHKLAMLKATDEYCPIFYNTKRFTLLASNTFGINPAGGGLFFYHWRDLPRVCTEGFFEDRTTGKKFYVYNTHLDHKSQEARDGQLDIILKYIEKNTDKKYPVILLGDFNMDIVNHVAEKCRAMKFTEMKVVAETVQGPQETQTGWKDNELKTIDHILLRPSQNNEIVKTYCVIKSPVGQYPSDHRPVYGDVIL